MVEADGAEPDDVCGGEVGGEVARIESAAGAAGAATGMSIRLEDIRCGRTASLVSISSTCDTVVK